MSVRTFDPVTQEIVGNALASIADEMATTIFRTAHSTVVRDGMDFSAALCDPVGETVAQAVTVPFHLGSVPHAMETLLAKWGDRMGPGDVFVMNDPFDGGIHLQDIFVFEKRGLGPNNEVLGRFAATGIRPKFYEKLLAHGIKLRPDLFDEVVEVP